MVLTPDTNMLVRIFIDDDSNTEQVETARSLVKTAKKLYIPQLVQAELVWVLKSAYKLKKSQILTILKSLYSHSIFSLQNPTIFFNALGLYEAGTADFSDYLIALEAQGVDSVMYTFDKKLAKSGLAKLAI